MPRCNISGSLKQWSLALRVNSDVLAEKPGTVARWIEQVDGLAVASAMARPEREAAFVQALGILMRMRPDGAGGPMLCPTREAELLGLVDAGACESAVLKLVPDQSGILTSRSAAGHHKATVNRGHPCGETTSVGSTLALAVVSAVAMNVVDAGEYLFR